MKYIRMILAPIILFIDAIIPVKKIQRSAEQQENVNARAKDYMLYQFQACPFCVKVRRQFRRLNIPIALRDAKSEEGAQELQEGGGKLKVPCLRIQNGQRVQWMYESNDIISYLQNNFKT